MFDTAFCDKKFIDSNDWESIEIIRRHNDKDAIRNSMDISRFEGLT